MIDDIVLAHKETPSEVGVVLQRGPYVLQRMFKDQKSTLAAGSSIEMAKFSHHCSLKPRL